MDEKLVIGVELLDYGKALAEVVAELGNAQLAAVEMCKILKEEDTYEGEGKAPIESYTAHLGEHTGRLLMLYQKAAEYAVTTYESLYASDAAMAAWLMKNAGGAVVDK